MPPQIARLVFGLLVALFFYIDWDKTVRTSKALWLPVIWLLINGSRPVSLWLQINSGVKIDNPDQYLDGSPVDRFVYSLLLAFAIVVLITRGSQVANLLKRNGPILVFFLYCALSTIWSDYTEVSFKRWVKALGDLAMVLIVLTDTDPIGALKRLVARVGFILIPASVLLIKYFPALGRVYNIWTWEPMFVGVADHKNTLGMICMVLGLAFEWRFVLIYQDRTDPRRTKRLCVYGALLGMVIWLFIQANSVTAQSCFILATILFLALGTRKVTNRRWLVHAMIAGLVMIPVATLFLGVGGSALEGMGRDSTLTGRTEIWGLVISMNDHPLIGTGFESFWLGKRAERMWAMYYFHPTQAHNGYIEIYLESGWIGILLLTAIIASGYRNAAAALFRNPDIGRIRLAFIFVALIYNLTEAGFKMTNLLWCFFLISAAVVPEIAVQEAVVPLAKQADGKPKLLRSPRRSVPDFPRKRLETV